MLLQSAPALVKPYLFTVDEFHQLAEAGILPEDKRVELIEGVILEMAPIGRRHLVCVDRLNRFLVLGLGERAIVRIHGTLRLSNLNEPLPDIVVLRERADFYAGKDADPSDVHLIVEVADTSLAYDRGQKALIYARAGVPHYWVADINGVALIVHREPTEAGYAQIQTVRRGGQNSLLDFPDLVLTVDQILGPPAPAEG